MSKHFQLSESIVDSFETAVRNSEAISWEDLTIFSPIGNNSGYGIVVWGENDKDGTRSFYVSLRQNFDKDSIATGKEIFTAVAPLDAGYESLLTAIDKVSAYFENSLKEPSAAPIFSGFPYGYYSQEVMQPLLDALNSGDFARAAELAPPKHYLCGYQEFDKEHIHKEYGLGWAGQFCETAVPAGRYPVFARQYSYNEREKVYTNDLKDFQGLYTFVCGNCIAESDTRPENLPYPNVSWESPYCHAVGESILEGNSSIHLLPPFEAVPVHFQYDGKDATTYDIVDTSLPAKMKQDPISLRNQSAYIRRTFDLSEKGRRLYDEFERHFTLYRFWDQGSVPEDKLSTLQHYSPEVLRELMDKNFVVRRGDEGVSYELSASIRLALFETRELSINYDTDGYKYKAEYERVKVEAEKKPALDQQIRVANSKSTSVPSVEGRSSISSHNR